MKKIVLASLAFCLVLAASGSARAATLIYTFDIGGLGTTGGFGDEFPTLIHDFGIEGTVTEVAFDVNYESFDPSWLSELQIAIDTDDDLSFDGDIDMINFGAPDEPGTFAAAGSIGANSFSSNGVVYLTIYEFFVDGVVPFDALIGDGSTVTVTYSYTPAVVPEPASLALASVGVLGVASTLLLRRRRRA
jgi:hypothetical protein